MIEQMNERMNEIIRMNERIVNLQMRLDGNGINSVDVIGAMNNFRQNRKIFYVEKVDKSSKQNQCK